MRIVRITYNCLPYCPGRLRVKDTLSKSEMRVQFPPGAFDRFLDRPSAGVMATTETFLRDVIENLDDDAPRLVFADWLEEQGNPRAEFIRVQCELATLDPYNTRLADLESRELKLIRKYSKGWAGNLRRFASRWWFHRGFVSGAKVSAKVFLGDGDQLLKLAPLEHVQLADPCDYLDQLAACRNLSGLQSISLRYGYIGRGGRPQKSVRWDQVAGDSYHQRAENYQAAADQNQVELTGRLAQSTPRLRSFLNSPELNGLRCLMLAGNAIGDAGAQVVSECRNLSQLLRLDLRDNDITPVGIEHLVNSPYLAKVKHLELESCQNNQPNYDDDTAGPLPRTLSPIVSQLLSLDLDRCCITVPGLRDLTSVGSPDSLSSLSLEGSPLYHMDWFEQNPPFAEVFLDSPLFNKLVHLNLSSCYLEPSDFQLLVDDNRFKSVCSLILNNAHASQEGAKAIAASSNASNLYRLSLNGSNPSSYGGHSMQLGDAGFGMLINSTQLTRLASLGVRRNGITQTGIKQAVDSRLLKQLYWIDLSHNPMGDEGAEILVAHGPWPRLAYLNVRSCGLSRASKAKLRAKFGYRVVY